MAVFISGSLAYDRIMDFPGKFSDHILPNKIHNINVSFGLDKLNIQFGGTAGNIVYSLALLGEQPYLISQSGNDFAPYQAWLKQHKVHLDFVQNVKSDQSATAHIITDKSDNQITGFYFGAMRVPVVKNKMLVQKFTKTIKNHSDQHIALLAAGNVDDMLGLVKLYQQNHIKYIFDPGQQLVWLAPEQIKTILKGAAGLIVNDYELALVEKKLKTTASKLQQQLEYLIVTLGEKGATWWVDGKQFSMPVAKPKQVVDPTGAGDAYRAGLLVGLQQDWDIETTGRVAALCATYAIEHYGTQQHSYSITEFKNRFYKLFKRKLEL